MSKASYVFKAAGAIPKIIWNFIRSKHQIKFFFEIPDTKTKISINQLQKHKSKFRFDNLLVLIIKYK
jgi:hypothetical protein